MRQDVKGATNAPSIPLVFKLSLTATYGLILHRKFMLTKLTTIHTRNLGKVYVHSLKDPNS